MPRAGGPDQCHRGAEHVACGPVQLAAARSQRWRTWGLYAGGMVGPFGGGLVNPMFPELRATFGASSGRIGWALTAYYVPFAALLLVSGTLGERLGRRRVVRLTFATYGLSCLVSAVAPSLAWFLVGRVGQGVANAFTTPLLLAGLADRTPAARLGRSVGIYASFQAAGQSLAPFVGGLAAELNWRWGFVGTAAVAFALIVAAPDGTPRTATDAPRLAPLVSARMGLLVTAAFSAAAGFIGLGFLVSLYGRDHLGLSASGAGLVLVTAGISGMALGARWGSLVDRRGGRVVGVAAAVSASALVAPIGLVGTVWALAALWATAGAMLALASVALQSLAAEAVPANRGGGVSAVLSFRFAGQALAPVFWLPIYAGSPRAAFGSAALVGLVAAGALARLGPAADRLGPAADRVGRP